MKLYSQVIFPRFYDRVMGKPHLAKVRHELLQDLSGEVLEIGVGTGLNLEHYPDSVAKVTTVDPNPGMNRQLKRRMESSGVEVDQRLLGGEELPFDENCFDFVVSTWTLCSIRGVEAAMDELYRVLRPGGRFLFLEHGLADEPKVQRWQRRLNWLQGRLADGCRLDLDVKQLLGRKPFTECDCQTYYMEKTPRTHGYTYQGFAVK